jgi:hypothetical protein
MTSMCPHCHNFTMYCTCATVGTSDHTTLLPSVPPQPAQTFTFTPQLTEEQICKIVGEEVRKALQEKTLQDEADEEEASPYPRIVRIADKATMHVKFEYDGVLYAGEVYPVEEKYD